MLCFWFTAPHNNSNEDMSDNEPDESGSRARIYCSVDDNCVDDMSVDDYDGQPTEGIRGVLSSCRQAMLRMFNHERKLVNCSCYKAVADLESILFSCAAKDDIIENFVYWAVFEEQGSHFVR